MLAEFPAALRNLRHRLAAWLRRSLEKFSNGRSQGQVSATSTTNAFFVQVLANLPEARFSFLIGSRRATLTFLAVPSWAQIQYSVDSSRVSRSRVGSNTQFKNNPRKRSAANPVARMNPYLACPITSLTAPIAKGPVTADKQVKKRITPAIEPCSDFGKQLMPLELMLG